MTKQRVAFVSQLCWLCRDRRNSCNRRSTRALWLLVLSLLGSLAWLRPVAAQPMLQQVATDVGVLVAVPEGLRATPGLSAGPGTAPLVVGLATFTDGAEAPLSVQIRRGEPHGWESLPAASPGMAAEWTRRFAAELQLPGAYDFTPGRYDPARGALSLQYKVAGPSSARRMQRLPDAHPFWAPTLEAGEDPRIAKCLLDALLGGQPAASEAEVGARVPAAAETCSVPAAMVADYLQQLGSAEFAPAVTTITQLSFFTRSGTIGALVMAPLGRQQAVDDAAALIWRETQVAEAELLPVESGTDLYRLAQLGGIVVGAVLGALLLGAGLSWALVRLGVRAVFAVGGSLGLWCALSLLGWLRGGLALEGALQVGGYLLTSGLAFRPLLRWLSSRGSPLGPGSLLGRWRGLRRSRGLSTVEFVVIVVLLACVSIGAWRIFGSNVKQAVFKSSGQLDALSSTQVDDFGPAGSGDPSASEAETPESRAGDPPSADSRSGDTRSGSDRPERRSGAGSNAAGSGTPGAGARQAARGTTGASGPTAARDPGSGSPGEARGSPAQGAGTGALGGLVPGPVVPPVPPPTALPPNAGRVVASAAKEPSLLVQGVDVTTDLVPWVSNAKDATIAITGVNPVTGEEVGTTGRVISGVFAVPAVGNVLKYIGKGGKYVFKGGKAAYEAVQTARAASKAAKAAAKVAEREALEAAARRTEKELAEQAAAAATKKQSEEAAREAANRALHEKYLDELRRNMGRPHVQDPKLGKIIEEQYREAAKIGSGSTADAVRHEAATGERVGGAWHRQKAEEGVGKLEKWLRNNPTASPGDRAAAENVLKDLQNALGGK